MSTNEFDREAYKALALAVLESGLEDLKMARKTRDRRLEAEVNAWLNSESNNWIFDFVPLCQWLGFSPSAIRERLKGLR